MFSVVRGSLLVKKVRLKLKSRLGAVEAQCEWGGEHSESTSSPVGAGTAMRAWCNSVQPCRWSLP